LAAASAVVGAPLPAILNASEGRTAKIDVKMHKRIPIRPDCLDAATAPEASSLAMVRVSGFECSAPIIPGTPNASLRTRSRKSPRWSPRRLDHCRNLL